MRQSYWIESDYVPFSIDLWLPNGSKEREVALVMDHILARAVFDAAVLRWPDKHVMLKQVCHVLADSRRQDA